ASIASRIVSSCRPPLPRWDPSYSSSIPSFNPTASTRTRPPRSPRCSPTYASSNAAPPSPSCSCITRAKRRGRSAAAKRSRAASSTPGATPISPWGGWRSACSPRLGSEAYLKTKPHVQPALDRRRPQPVCAVILSDRVDAPDVEQVLELRQRRRPQFCDGHRLGESNVDDLVVLLEDLVRFEQVHVDR